MWHTQPCRYYSGAKLGSPPRASKIFSSTTGMHTFCGWLASTFIRRAVPVSRICWSIQSKVLRFGTRQLGYFHAHGLTAAAEFPLDSSSKRCMSVYSITMCSTAVSESTETLRTPLRTVLIFGTCSRTIKWKKCKQITCNHSSIHHIDQASLAK
jgi:hypothetical protein